MLHIFTLYIQSNIEKELLDSNYIIITAQFQNDSSNINTHALVDCSTTSYTFIDEEFARDHVFPLYKLKKPHCLIVINARPIESDLITHITKLHIVITSYTELIRLFVIKLGHYSIVLDLL